MTTSAKNRLYRITRLLIIGGCLLAGLFFVGCRKAETVDIEQKAFVEVYAATRGDLSLKNTYIGMVSAESTVYVVPYVSAEVLRVHVKVGDTVSAGDVLAKLDDEAAQLQMDSAQASFDSARAGAKSQLGGTWDVQSEQTQAGIAQLYASIQMYEQQLRDAEKQLRDLDNMVDDSEEAVQRAQTAYADAQKKYLSAASLALGFQSVLANYPSLATSAMLTGIYTEAMQLVSDYAALNATTVEAVINDATALGAALASKGADVPMYAAAIPLQRALQGAGIPVEYITNTGLNASKQEMELAASAYEKASSGLSTLESSKPTIKNAITQLRGAIDQARIQLHSAQEIAALTDGPVKNEAWQALEAQIAAAGVGVDSAQMQLDFYTLTAPISGVVSSVGIAEHGIASSSAPAFTIANPDTMLVSLYVSEDVRNALTLGQHASVEKKGVAYDAVITEIGTGVDLAKGLFLIKARVDTRGDEFAPGANIFITADVSNVQNAIILPYDAIYYEANRAYVFLVSNGTAEKAYVETDISDGTYIAITDGLHEDDIVITSWFPGLQSGMPVSFDEAQLAQARQDAVQMQATQPAVAPAVSTPAPTPEPEKRYVEITDSKVNFRREPDTKSDRIRKLSANERAELLGEEEGWYFIELDGIQGYVSKEYAAIVPAGGAAPGGTAE